MRDRAGEDWGAYVLGTHLAEGSTGSIYEARQRETGERVAVKVLHPQVAEDTIAVERFRREYETAQSLDHRYVVRALDFGSAPDGVPFMTMELLEGEELNETLSRDGAFSPARATRILCQLALALHDAHRKGVIHRDLKPANVLLCAGPRGEEVRVLDFGSVKLQRNDGPKLTALGTTLGSPYYMSPEQARGELDIDQRSDVFALSAIAHELTTGMVAFAGKSVAEILTKLLEAEPAPVSSLRPGYPWAFDDAIKKGLRKDRAERFASTLELAESLLGALSLEPDVTRWAGASTAEIEAELAAKLLRPDTGSAAPLERRSSIPLAPPMRDRRVATWVLGLVLAGALMTGAWLLSA